MPPNQPNSSSQREGGAIAPSDTPHYQRWLALGFIGIYFAWFFLQPIAGEIRRLEQLVLILLPVELWQVTIGYGVDHLQIGFFDRSVPLSLSVLWFTAAWWIGRPCLRLFGGSLSRLESVGISCLGGLSLLSTTTLLLGLAGLLNRPALIAAVLGWCVVSLALQKKLGATAHAWINIPNDLQDQGQASRWMWRLVPVGVCLLATMYIANGLMPPFEFDVVEYHMQGPKEFFEQGKIDFAAHNVYTNMPLGIEMHSLAAMVLVGGPNGWWLGSITGNCMISMFSLLAAGIVGGYTARYFGRSLGWATAATLLAAPGNILVAGCGLIDSAMGAYLLATAVCLQAWKDNSIDSSERTPFKPGSLILACFFAGTAAACKYTGVVFACLPVAFYVLQVIYTAYPGRRPTVKLLMAACLVCGLTCSPWIVKNALWTSNPVYPLAANWFGSSNLTEDQAFRWARAHQVPKSSSGSAYDWPSLRESLLRVAGKSEYLPVVLVPMVVVGVFASRAKDFRRPVMLPLILGGWVLVVWWCVTHRIDRFWLPTLPLFSIAAAAGMRWLLNRAQSALVSLSLLLTMMYACVVILAGSLTDCRWFISYDSLRRDAGTEETSGRVPKTIDWINANAKAEGKILAIGEARAFFFEHPLLYATCFNTPPGEESLRSFSASQQSDWLRQNGVTHMFVNWSEIDRYRSPGNYGFSNWPQRSDIQTMIDGGVVRRVIDWPFDPQVAELLEVQH